ncbi:MAG: calcium-binding protein [Solirubrobacteraceae bacterium]
MRRLLVPAAVLLLGAGVPAALAQEPVPEPPTEEVPAPNHAPVCPAEAHIRIPMRAQDDYSNIAVVHGNCSDEDGDALTFAGDEFPQYVSLARSIYEDVEHVTLVGLVPLGGWTGTDLLRYHARDADSVSNTADFFIEVVAGLDEASAAWIGTPQDDVLVGTEIEDDISGQGGDDELEGGSGADEITGGGGADEISAGPGNDTIGVRDRRRDVVVCGRGRDTVIADHRDVLRGCERVKRRS